MTVQMIGAPSFGANCYFLISERHAWVVDPSRSSDAILREATRLGLRIEGILLTHGHFDHTTSVDTLRDVLPCPVMIHKADAIMLTDGKKNAFYDFYGTECIHRPADILLEDGQVLTLGEESIQVIHTPGHTKGSVCFLCGDLLLTGDTLFSDTVGRCDLWGGNEEDMRTSLQHLRTLPPTLDILPGHGLGSTLGAALDQAAYYL